MDGKELSHLSYTYDLAGNKLTSTETVDGKEEKTTFSYDEHNRLTKLENKEGTITYTYDKNGNRIAQEKNNEKLEYIYDTENRLLAVKDKDGLLMAALYDGDDNRVFTASRKEGKNTYQLFRRKEKKKSPQTSPNGEEPSLFWYGFSQNVLQALSSFPQTVGSIWHHIFDDVSSAYHQKVAKDKATKDGLVVNPPSLGNLPGEGDVTYASEVKDVLIPYTTREDTYKYYEERNYVNDVNRKHTEVLQTYDHDLKARETYSYGHGRTSYLNNQTNKTYGYLTNQSGSVTGLTQDGEAVASSSYQLYGSTKKSTDETGNPYAYNGEARDGTGLDYLRARYYDSHAGTFLTEDSYQGEATDPLSQNRYAYVHNNPVNYTDPSGHRLVLTTMGGGRKLSPIASAFTAGIKNFTSMLVAPIRTAAQFASVSIKVATATVRYTMVKAHPNHYTDTQKAKIRSDYLAAVGEKVAFNIREAGNLAVNWTKALHQTLRHVCDPKTTKARDKGSTPKPISFGGGGVASWEGTSGPSSRYQSSTSGQSKTKKATSKRVNGSNYGVNLGGVASWSGTSSTSNQPQSNASVVPKLMTEEELVASRKAGLQLLKVLGGELSGWYNVKRLWTGKDPVTGEDANRWWAGVGLAFDVATYAFSVAKIGKLATAAKTIDTVDDVSDATTAYRASKGLKTADTVDDVSDTSRAFKAADTADAVDDVGDTVKGLRGTKSLDELPQNVQDAYKGYDGVGWKGNYKGQTPKTAAGRKFDNEDLYLPELDSSGNRIAYKEYDVNNYIPGSMGRDSQRLVRGSDGSVYYTWNHYDNFIKVE